MSKITRNGYLCVLTLIAVSFAINTCLTIFYRYNSAFANWLVANSYFAEGTIMIFRGFVWLITAYVLSGARSLNRFACKAGLDQFPTLAGWLFALLAAGVGLFDLYAIHRGWTEANQFAPSFRAMGGGQWAFFIAYSLLVSPFFEEVVMRGFLFRAFRESYDVVLSTFLVLMVQGYFHWGIISRDLVAFILMVIGGIILCAVREQTDSVWNCILFHGIYNATVTRQWGVGVFSMVITLLIIFVVSLRPKIKCANGAEQTDKPCKN